MGKRLEKITEADLSGIEVSKAQIEAVVELFTPIGELEVCRLGQPEVISPKVYRDFEMLSLRWDQIRNLELVPIKSPNAYKKYHMIKHRELVMGVGGYLEDAPLVLVENKYPYWLPRDARQQILWMNDPMTEDNRLAKFLAKVMIMNKLQEKDVIIFERPIGIDTKLVRGTIPEFRHLHFWTKKY